MKTEKDKKAIQKGENLIEEQVQNTKKLNLGLDADSSSKHHHRSNSKFDGFINPKEPSRLDEK